MFNFFKPAKKFTVWIKYDAVDTWVVYASDLPEEAAYAKAVSLGRKGKASCVRDSKIDVNKERK